MSKPITHELLVQFSQFIATRMGLYFATDRYADLERGMRSAAKRFGFSDADAWVRWVLANPLMEEHLAILADCFTIGETYFFRHPESFTLLEHHLLPPLIVSRRQSKKQLRIWSAGCSTGEEPYSLAIMLHRLLPDIRDWHITIQATDVNRTFLKHAQAATYGEWSFRGVSQDVRAQYFTATSDKRYRLRPEIRSLVSFSPFNLAVDAFPAMGNEDEGFDLILCRNVLIYFSASLIQQILQGFHHALRSGGWLLTSPVELTFANQSPFVVEPHQMASLMVKGTAVSHQTTGNFVVEPPPQPAKPVRFPISAQYTPAAPAPRPQSVTVPTPVVSKPIVQARPAAPAPDPYARASEMVQAGRHGEAISLLLASLSDMTGTHTGGEPQALLARAYANQGNLTEAQRWAAEAIRCDRTNAGHHYLDATILYESGNTDAAIAALHRTLFLQPDCILAHYMLGEMNRAIHRDTEARKHLRNAMKFLQRCQPSDTLPEADGMTAGRLADLITAVLGEAACFTTR